MPGSIRRRLAAGLVCGVVFVAETGVAPASDTCVWWDVAAEAPIDHAVMVRGPFDGMHREFQLAGPVAVMACDEDVGSCFTVYAVTAPSDEPPRTTRVAGGEMLRLGPPAFLLMPARRLQDGAPAAEPPRGVYEVRPVLAPPAVIEEGPDAVGPPAYLCLPVDYRHHFDRVPVEVADRGLVIFATRELTPATARVATADDFGIARLAARGTGRTTAWLPVQPVPDGGQP